MPEKLRFPQVSQTQCNLSECGKEFTPDMPGKVCSGCKRAFYCQSLCQRDDWSRRHRDECKHLRILEADRKSSSNRPNLLQDLNHFKNISDGLLQIIARSALKIGHREDMSRTHFLHVELAYNPPPEPRRSVISKTPIGDERDFFDFTGITVRPDSYLYQHSLADGPTQKKAACDEQRRPGVKASVAYIIYHASEEFEGPPHREYRHSVISAVPIEHFDIQDTPPFVRQLNPRWQHLAPLYKSDLFSNPRNKEENTKNNVNLYYIDLVMSEKLEVLERISFAPAKGGWPEYRRLIKDAFPFLLD